MKITAVHISNIQKNNENNNIKHSFVENQAVKFGNNNLLSKIKNIYHNVRDEFRSSNENASSLSSQEISKPKVVLNTIESFSEFKKQAIKDRIDEIYDSPYYTNDKIFRDLRRRNIIDYDMQKSLETEFHFSRDGVMSRHSHEKLLDIIENAEADGKLSGFDALGYKNRIVGANAEIAEDRYFKACKEYVIKDVECRNAIEAADAEIARLKADELKIQLDAAIEEQQLADEAGRILQKMKQDEPPQILFSNALPDNINDIPQSKIYDLTADNFHTLMGTLQEEQKNSIIQNFLDANVTKNTTETLPEVFASFSPEKLDMTTEEFYNACLKAGNPAENLVEQFADDRIDISDKVTDWFNLDVIKDFFEDLFESLLGK